MTKGYRGLHLRTKEDVDELIFQDEDYYESDR